LLIGPVVEFLSGPFGLFFMALFYVRLRDVGMLCCVVWAVNYLTDVPISSGRWENGKRMAQEEMEWLWGNVSYAR